MSNVKGASMSLRFRIVAALAVVAGSLAGASLYAAQEGGIHQAQKLSQQKAGLNAKLANEEATAPVKSREQVEKQRQLRDPKKAVEVDTRQKEQLKKAQAKTPPNAALKK